MFCEPFRQDSSFTLLTDLYQLTMAYAYWRNGMAEQRAEFHMFYRNNPFQGGFVVCAGLGSLIDFIKQFRFTSSDLDYLATLKDRAGNALFNDEFLTYLGNLQFSCDLYAVAEGTVVFPNEPLLRVQGPILQAQLLETVLLNTINFQSLIATKAARLSIVAKEDSIVDFGLRRAQGLSALAASRACYIGGCSGTSNVLAGKLFGIPVVGTHAHSWVMAFADERQAFQSYADVMPDNCVFLVDTYGSINGIHNAIDVALKLRAQGHEIIGVRLDSGDLAYFSKRAREMLDEAGLPDALVMASNELDEYVISSLKNQGAKINAWGVGTKLITAYDDPALSGVYKLAAVLDDSQQWQYKLKLSEQRSKMSIPGILQVYRFYNEDNKMIADAITDLSELPETIENIIDPNDDLHRKNLSSAQRFEALLQPVFKQGRLLQQPTDLQTIRDRVQHQLNLLDDSHKRFEFPHIYPVGLSVYLNKIRDNIITIERERLTHHNDT